MLNNFQAWQQWLYFLGFIANIFFFLRFFIQWLQSEKKKHSYTSMLFWKLSAIGNGLLALHYWIQLQFPLACIQVINLYMAHRNLKISQGTAKTQKLTFHLSIFFFLLTLTLALFILPQIYLKLPIQFFRLPEFWDVQPTGMYWHLFGTLGALGFALRFWIQWFSAEKHQKSTLTSTFWKFSLLGACATGIYAIRIGDAATCLSMGFAIPTALRNLFLLKRSKASLSS